jgi:hypothetical protein
VKTANSVNNDFMSHKSILFTLFISITITAFGQNFEPFDLAKRIFNKAPFQNIEKYIDGEYKGRPNGQDLQIGSVISFLLLGQTSNKAVVAMTILDSTGKGFDTYLHFKKDSIWKMNAFRALAMTGIIEQVKNELEKMTPKQVDDLIEKSKKAKDKEYVVFSSREDYYFELGNAKLTLELDENIIKHFYKHKASFEHIKEVALKELSTKHTGKNRSIRLVENLKSDYRNLLISSVSFGDYRLGGNCLAFSIGGMLDNTVGFLYVKDKKDLPEMNDYRVIMVREIGGGWYLYKTT